MDAYNSTRDFWKSKDTDSAQQLSEALSAYFILFASENCLLEDMEVSPRDVMRAFQNSQSDEDVGAQRLLQNQKRCFDRLVLKAAAGERISAALLSSVNETLAAGIKTEPDEEDDAFLSPEELEEALNALIAEVNAYDGPEILKAAAYFEAKLEYLQPVPVFCGLTARILANFFLLTRNEPPLVFFEKYAERYFDALESYDISEDIVPLQKLMREETVETWKILLDTK